MQDSLVVEPDGPATAAVVWLHGLGASASDFVPALPYLGLPEGHGVRFVFPQAPERPVTINGGYIMPSWYDILAMSPERQVDREQLAETTQRIAELLEQLQKQGIPADKILLLGFSQGGAITYQVALSHPQLLAAAAVLSSYLLSPELLAENTPQLPILIQHGQQDAVVPVSLGESAREQLQSAGLNPTWQAYAMDHEVTADSLAALGLWMRQQLEI